MDEADTLPAQAKLAEARHAALKLLQASRITSAPVKLNDTLPHVRKTFDITIMGATEAQIGSKIDAVTKREGTDIYILYNKDRHINRQRFSFAHELGHLHLGHVHGGSNIDLSSQNFDEIEANQFAAHLLMPPAFLRNDIKAGLKNVSELAKKYQVSEEALWWQIERAGLLKLF